MEDAALGDRARVSSAGTTKIITGGLEMSKTDLATEIANMITTQRGYQANTRIITTLDSGMDSMYSIWRWFTKNLSWLRLVKTIIGAYIL